MATTKGHLNQAIQNRSGDLLAAKLSTPILRSTIVRRTRLTEILNIGMQRQVTLVVAPAGYGKTTLVREWLASISNLDWPVGWITLDPYDNDPLHFWSYLIASLKNVYPSLQFNLQEFIRGQQSLSYSSQLAPLLNEITEIPYHFSLVFDDFHEIKNQEICLAFSYFIEYLPKNCHLILVSRVIPSLTLSRLRAHGQLIEISAKDLSFTPEEAKTYLSQVMNLTISWDEALTLTEKTEGWIAGLQLAALSLQGRPVSRDFIANFSGSHQHILDYLTEEVLNRQDKKTRDFLMQTSILHEISAPLCNAILNRKDSQEMLDFLERSNLFITPLDEHRRWYRYHALFAELLRIQLDRAEPEIAPQLHLATCHWLREHGYPEKAVLHALAAGEVELAADIVEACALEAIIRMDIMTVLHWFNCLPDELVKTRPRLLTFRILANLTIGKAEELDEQLILVKESLDTARKGGLSEVEIARLQRYVNAMLAAAACTRGDFSLGIPISQQALEDLQPEDYFFLGLIEHYLAYAYQAAGKLSDGTEAQERACQNALRHEFHNEFIVSLSEKARFYRLQGRLHAAAEAYHQAIDYADEFQVEAGVRVIPIAGLSDILREWNHLTEANKLLIEPIHYYLGTYTRAFDWFYAINVYLAIARNQMVHGNLDEAAKCIHLAKQLAQTYHFIPDLAPEVEAAQVQLWLAQGNLQAATQWVKHKELHLSSGVQSRLSSFEQIAMAEVYYALDRLTEADLLLSRLLKELDNSEHGECLLKCLILKALVHWKEGSPYQAMSIIDRALLIAESQGRIRSFIDRGATMKALLSHRLSLFSQDVFAKEPQPKRAFLMRLLEHFDEKAIWKAPSTKRQTQSTEDILVPLVEPLTERELEVLHLLVKGYSAGDIAKDLVISVNTAKAHIKNIYQKLDAHTRKEVIEKAITLGLLSREGGAHSSMLLYP